MTLELGNFHFFDNVILPVKFLSQQMVFSNFLPHDRDFKVSRSAILANSFVSTSAFTFNSLVVRQFASNTHS